MNGNLAITVLLPFYIPDGYSTGTVNAYGYFLWCQLWWFYQFNSDQYTWYECSGSNTDRWLSDVQEWTAERRALDMALVASTFGGLISAFCLLFLHRRSVRLL